MCVLYVGVVYGCVFYVGVWYVRGCGEWVCLVRGCVGVHVVSTYILCVCLSSCKCDHAGMGAGISVYLLVRIKYFGVATKTPKYLRHKDPYIV